MTNLFMALALRELRKKVIAIYIEKGLSPTAISREEGIIGMVHRSTVNDWIQKWREEQQQNSEVS